MGAGKPVSVYEFSDHVRVSLHQVCLLGSVSPPPVCDLHIRRDCMQFVPPSPGCSIRYSNKYLMMARFFSEAVFLRRKVIVTTGPEASSRTVKHAFTGMLKVFKNQISIFIIVRDSKPERGQYLMNPELYSARSVLAVESDALLLNAKAAGYAPGGYVYPTPILSPAARAGDVTSSRGSDAPLKILITGSLDGIRRNYETLFEALAILRQKKIPAEVIVGGHCMTDSAPDLLRRLTEHCEKLIAKDLLTDAELDEALTSSDAIVCLNRPEFYGAAKGSGAIGDAFFAGRKLLIHADLTRPVSADSQFYMPFTSVDDLATHLLKAAADESYLRVDREILNRQMQYFSRLVGDWLER
jgi:hypothetical protein